LIRETPTISAKAIAEEIGIGSRSVERNINFLKKAGLIERLGTTKSGH
jgi:predicted HTH transcriptional regulator